MSSSYFAGADLSTVTPNPEVVSYGGTDTADQISQISNVAGQWGATIASIVSGNPVATVATPTGGVRTIGAAGSTYQTGSVLSGNGSMLLLLGVLLVVVVLIVKE